MLTDSDTQSLMQWLNQKILGDRTIGEDLVNNIYSYLFSNSLLRLDKQTIEEILNDHEHELKIVVENYYSSSDYKLLKCATALKEFCLETPTIDQYAEEDPQVLTVFYEYEKQDDLISCLNDFCRNNNYLHHCTWGEDENEESVVKASVVIEIIDNKCIKSGCYAQKGSCFHFI